MESQSNNLTAASVVKINRNMVSVCNATLSVIPPDDPLHNRIKAARDSFMHTPPEGLGYIQSNISLALSKRFDHVPTTGWGKDVFDIWQGKVITLAPVQTCDFIKSWYMGKYPHERLGQALLNRWTGYDMDNPHYSALFYQDNPAHCASWIWGNLVY